MLDGLKLELATECLDLVYMYDWRDCLARPWTTIWLDLESEAGTTIFLHILVREGPVRRVGNYKDPTNDGYIATTEAYDAFWLEGRVDSEPDYLKEIREDLKASELEARGLKRLTDEEAGCFLKKHYAAIATSSDVFTRKVAELVKKYKDVLR